MASKKFFHAKPNYIYPNPSPDTTTDNDNMVFEFDESDVWNSKQESQQSNMSKKTIPSSRSYKKLQDMHVERKQQTAGKSLPVNIPDWSRISKDHYKGHERRCSDEDMEDYEEFVDGDMRMPPHEYLARNRGASFSVHEGIGRTLKGRDLSRVRNAIWEKTGFQD